MVVVARPELEADLGCRNEIVSFYLGSRLLVAAAVGADMFANRWVDVFVVVAVKVTAMKTLKNLHGKTATVDGNHVQFVNFVAVEIVEAEVVGAVAERLQGSNQMDEEQQVAAVRAASCYYR